MSDIKIKKHKQSKFLTIMIVPYSSHKTKSLRIPHWILHAVLYSAAGLILAAFFIWLRASYFRSQAESLNAEWNKSIELNTQLLEEKKETERRLLEEKLESERQLLEEKQENKNSAEKQKESFERQLDSYESQLEYYSKKARELEERINELNDVKEEIYDFLTSSSDIPISRYNPDTSMGGPYVGVTYEDETLESIYDNLDERLSMETLEYASIISEAQKVKLFLDAKPSIWPVYGVVTSKMGMRFNPFNSGMETHSGLDIAVPTGTYVRATGNGTITYSGWKTGYGYLVIIDHGYGFETYYGHNSRLLCNVGDKVSRGDYIAVSGSSGRSTGPHVHYEVRLYSIIKNPSEYMR